MPQPLVEVIQETPDGGVTVRVSRFTENPMVTPAQIAAIDGVIAELTFADAAGDEETA
jgi:hypothetical protein